LVVPGDGRDGEDVPEQAVAINAAAAASEATEAGWRRTPYSVPHNRGVVARERREIPVPSWTAPLFLVLAVLLIPWIVYLGLELPEQATSAHWDVAWVGFDAMEFVALASTGWLAHRRSTWVEVAATAAAVMLVVDAWFDVVTANGGWRLTQAIVLGVGIELPLASASLYIARHAELVRRRPVNQAHPGRQPERTR
jgi:hypothetical protein